MCRALKLQTLFYLLINVVIAKKVEMMNLPAGTEQWLTFSSWDTQDFPSSNTTNTLTPSTSSITNLLRRTQTNSPSHKPPTELPRWAAVSICHWSQAFGCFRWTRSAICLALYRDTPIPTVAIVMAMGSMRLLCGCIRTSPETCLCRQDGQTDVKATMCNLCCMLDFI